MVHIAGLILIGRAFAFVESILFYRLRVLTPPCVFDAIADQSSLKTRDFYLIP